MLKENTKLCGSLAPYRKWTSSLPIPNPPEVCGAQLFTSCYSGSYLLNKLHVWWIGSCMFTIWPSIVSLLHCIILANVILNCNKIQCAMFPLSLCPTEMVESLKNSRVLHCIDSEWDFSVLLRTFHHQLHFGPFLEHLRYHCERCWRLRITSSSWNGSTHGKYFNESIAIRSFYIYDMYVYDVMMVI